MTRDHNDDDWIDDSRGRLGEETRGVNEGHVRLIDPQFPFDGQMIYDTDFQGIEIGPESTIDSITIESNSFSGRSFVVTKNSPFHGYFKGPGKIRGYNLADNDGALYTLDVIFWTKPPPTIGSSWRASIPQTKRATADGNDIPIALLVSDADGSDEIYVGDIEDLTFHERLGNTLTNLAYTLQGSYDKALWFDVAALGVGAPTGVYRITDNRATADMRRTYMPRIPFLRITAAAGENAGPLTLTISGKKRG